jgi:hypothetical protein
VVHTYHPGYSGGRDEDYGSKPAWENSLRDPISKKKKTHHKNGLLEWLKVKGPKFKPQYHKKKSNGWGR